MPKVRGRVLVFLDGFLVWETRNILTNKYQEAHMNWLLGKNPDLVNYIAVGMDDTTPTSTDRSLYNERHRREISLKLTRGGYIARYNATWPSTEPPAMEAAISLKEVGLFDKGPITIQNYSLEDWSAGAAAAPDNWTLVGTGSAIIQSTTRYHGTSSSQVSAGSELTKLYQQISNYSSYAGKAVSFWAAVRHNVANEARVYIDDGINKATSSYHTGGNSWEILKAELTLDSSLTKLEIGLEIVANGGSPYFDWTNLVEDGNLWARSLIDVSKLDGQVLNIVWEVFAATSEEEVEVAKTAFAKEELTVSSTVVALTSSVYRPTGQTAASKAFITVEDNPIRYWYDGSDPTSTSGHLAAAGATIELEPLEDIENFKCIRATAADAAIKVTYER